MSVKSSKGSKADVLPWGLASLDRATKGLHAGQLALVEVSHAGVGRPALALRVVDALALEQGIPLLLVSLEMITQQVLVRLACLHSRIDLLQLYLGKGSETAQEKLKTTLAEISRAPMQIYATPRMTLAELQVETQRSKERRHIRLLIVDGFHLLVPDVPATAGEPRKWRPAIAKGIRQLAKDLKIPALVLHQVTEEAWTSKTSPAARELKVIENEADIVCRLAPHEAFEEQKGRAMQSLITAGMDVVKNDNGKSGKVRLKFLPRFAQFE